MTKRYKSAILDFLQKLPFAFAQNVLGRANFALINPPFCGDNFFTLTIFSSHFRGPKFPTFLGPPYNFSGPPKLTCDDLRSRLIRALRFAREYGILECKTRQNAKLAQMQNSPECKTRPNAKLARMQNSPECKTRPNAKLARMQNSPEHKILPNENFGVKATSECKTPSNENTIKDDSHRKIQVLYFGGYYAS